MTTLVFLLVLAVAAVVTVVTLERVITRTELGLGLALVAVFLNTLGVELDIHPAGFRVGDVDVVAALLLVAAVARLLRSERVAPLQWVAIGFGLLVLWSLVTGVLEHGTGTAVNDARTYVRFIAAVLYFSTTDPSDALFDRLMTLLGVLAGALVVLTVVRWTGNALGLGDLWFMRSGDLRVIDSFRTLILLQVLLLVWGGRPPLSRHAVVAAPVLLAAVVLLQHRTLWIALAVGALISAARSRRLARRLVPAAVTAIVVGGVLSFTLFGGPGTIRTELEDSATNADTFVWRVEGWRQLVLERGPDDVYEVAVGHTFGSGFERRLRGATVDVSPHNFLVQTYLRTGLFGSFLLVSLLVTTMVRLTRTQGWGRYLHGAGLFVILVTQILFLQTSHPSFEQAILLGLAVATAVRPPEHATPGPGGRARATAQQPAGAGPPSARPDRKALA